MITPLAQRDGSSLLVPIQLDAWVVDSTNQELLAWYLPDYGKLRQFKSPMPDAFEVSNASPPARGIHLRWTLPDALTHGKEPPGGGPIAFPLVPNRWLIARFSPHTGSQWPCKLWVIQSDAIDPNAGTSPFLDPVTPSGLQAAPRQSTTFAINETKIGRHFTIEEWESRTGPDGVPGAPLFLQAVGPANVSFTAYVPFVQDVFAFVDTDLPAEGTGTYAFTYLVAGWYSAPDVADPLRGVASFVPGVWKSEADWARQTPAERFQTVLADLNWSVAGDAGSAAPETSLYHALMVDVPWPYGQSGAAPIDPTGVQVVIGNSTVDALAALVQAQARTQAQQDARNHDAWVAAGTTLSDLLSAAVFDALDEYDAPGGLVRLQQRIKQSWFGAQDGGTEWHAVPAVALPGSHGAMPTLTDAQAQALATQLAALNADQRDLDAAQRRLEALQSDLYAMWLKIARANSFGWGEAPTTTPPWNVLKPFIETTIYPALMKQVSDQQTTVKQSRQALPDPTDAAAANAWADAHWTFPSQSQDGLPVTLASLGLALKASAAPRYWHPRDPVVLIAGAHRSHAHGEDGLLACRLPGQTITGLRLADQSTPSITVQSLAAAGLSLDPYGPVASVPAIPDLVHEAFFADPANAPAIAQAAGVAAAQVQDAIGEARWIGQPPVAFAIARWQQAWIPVFLEWELRYFPTGTGAGEARQFSSRDWTFGVEDPRWNGTGLDATCFVPYKGRTLLRPFEPAPYQQRIQDYLARHADIDSVPLQSLLDTFTGADLLAQSLGSLTDHLITRALQELFPPPSDIGTLVGDQDHFMPVLEGTGSNVRVFYPVRGGFVQFQRMQIVDAFGQVLTLSNANTPQGFQPLLAASVSPLDPNRLLPVGSVQLPPRFVQSARLDLRWSDEGIRGWLLPNHLDRGLVVYDNDGLMLGELLPLAAADNWRPRPGASDDATPPPATPSDIADATLRAVIVSLASQPVAVFQDVYLAIDETLWTVDPLGGRKDQFLSVLMGRPLAIVQASLQLRLHGDPVADQRWNAMMGTNPNAWIRDTGGVESASVPVRLGNLALRDDGLIGYFKADGSEAYARFYAAHEPDAPGDGDAYVRPILQHTSDGQVAYQGDLYLTCADAPVTVTMIVDPRGSVDADAGVLPVTRAALPAHAVETFIRQLAVTFRTGPILSPPDTLRLPLPAERQGTWSWLQLTPTAPGAPPAWTAGPIVDADDRARFPDVAPSLREGWLKLTGL